MLDAAVFGRQSFHFCKMEKFCVPTLWSICWMQLFLAVSPFIFLIDADILLPALWGMLDAVIFDSQFFHFFDR